MSEPRKRRALGLVVVVALALAFLGQCVLFARANGQTYDEGVTLAAGLRLLETGTDDVNLEHPPLAKLIIASPVRLLARPRLDVDAWRKRGESGFGLGRDLLYASGVPHERLLWLGRAPVIVMAAALLALIGLFATRLFGPKAGLLALVLATFDPNLVAHGSLMSLDLPITLFATTALYSVYVWLTSRRVRWLALAGIAGGCALATKHSGPLYVAAACTALFVHALRTSDTPAWWDPETAEQSRGRALLRAAGNAFLLVGVALVVVRLAVGSAGYPAYLTGLKAQLAHQSYGHPAFFLGEISRHGWSSYYPVALALKLPPLTLALAALSLVAFRRGAPLAPALASVLVPLAALFATLLFAQIDIGVRYALPLWPLLIVLASRVASFTAPSWQSVALGLALLHHVVAAVRIAPHDLAFFSDLSGGPRRGHRYLADSNLDWGQDVSTLGRWLARRDPPRRLYLSYFGSADPAAYGVRYYPAPNSCPHPAPWRRTPEPALGQELLAVSAMNLQGVFFGDTRAWAWLATRRPIAVLGYTISVYDITDDAAAHENLALMYQRYGPPELLTEERERVRQLEAR